MQPVPVGNPGELWIGGDGLARGYLNRPELTAEKFIPNPFRTETGARLYRTGDLVRYLPDGNVEYLGRLDNQVKLRGHRIELGEIETLLAQHPAISAVVVMAREDTPGEKRLVAYLIAKNGKPADTFELRAFLQSKLPDYMVPSTFVNLERFPMTANGKVDRKAFPKPENRSLTNETAQPATATEIALTKIWIEVLGVQNIDVNDNFFDLGGHSLLAMRVIEKTRQCFEKNVVMNWLFIAPTIAQFSKLLQVEPDSTSRLFAGLRGQGTGVPFFYVPQIHGFGFMPADLARHLNDKVRYFDGLQYPGLNGGEPMPRTLEEIAAYMVPQIQAIWPNGPYYLMGWSFGGAMAFEIAHQLKAKGLKVKLVLLIDSRALGPSRQIELSLKESFKRFMQHMSKLPGRERLTLLGQTIARRFGFSPSPVKDIVANEPSGEMTPIMEASLQATRGYRPKPYDGQVVLFQIEKWEFFEGFRHLPDPSFGWNELVRGGLKIVRVPGDHTTIVLEPAVATLAKSILEQIEQCK
jgi:thioesterase domain-containing protein/aryl carrier-like protein